ncbi:MAG: Uma2 family endonuclease [Bacteroidota bacterium]
MAERKLDRIYTLEEYLQLEKAEPQTRYEYVDGMIYAMAGGTIKHGMLISNTLYWVRESLKQKGSTCKTFSGDVKVAIPSSNAYLRPDVFVVCGKIYDEENPNQAIKNPKLIIEVLSPSTQNYDQTHKFRLYRSLASVDEYVMIDQEKAIIESFVKTAEDQWLIRTFVGLAQTFELKSIGVQIRMQDIYQDVM